MAVLPIGFFAPLPLPMMIPFMGIQSAVMAEQFGTLFQYGKRRISAMSNEEFNKLTPEMLQERITTQIQGMIPEMEKQIQAMRPMVLVIMKEFAEYVRLATEAIAKGGSEYLEHAAHGHIFGHGDSYVDPTQPPPTGTPGICPAGSHWDSIKGQCIPDTIIEPTPITEPIPVPTPEPTPTDNPVDSLEAKKLVQVMQYYINWLNDKMKFINTQLDMGNLVGSYLTAYNASLDLLNEEVNKYHILTGIWYETNLIGIH